VAKTEHAGEVRVQPHGDSYFLPGKVTGRDVTFLLDSGCTTNLLSQRVFNTLPLKERKGLAPYTREPGTLADGWSIPFDGVIELTGCVRDQAIQEIFVISPLEEDAILGMPFLKRHGCRTDFSKSAVLMAGRELTCVDKSGRPLERSVQAVRKCTILGRSRATIHCRVNDSQLFGLGVVESAHTRIQLGSSLNRLTDRGEILVQCVNPFSEAVTIPSGYTLGRFHSIQEKDIGPSLGDATEGPHQSPSLGRGAVPPHVQELYQTACDGCASNQERQVMARLLCEYKDVFSSGNHDVGLTSAVRHEIPLVAGTTPVRQPTRRLGPEKERQVSRQIRDLLDRDPIEPAHSA